MSASGSSGAASIRWVILIGTAVRLAALALPGQTVDQRLWNDFARLAAEHGIADAYQQHWLLVHPPLALFLLRVLTWLGDFVSITPATGLKLVQILADAFAALSLLRISTSRRNVWMWFFSPIVILVAAFHTNTDSLVLSLMIASIALLSSGRAFPAGITFGLAAGFKIFPLLALPVFLFWPQHRWKFLAGFAPLFMLPYALLGGDAPQVLSRVFGYGGMGHTWGLPLLLRATGGLFTLLISAGFDSESMRSIRQGAFDAMPVVRDFSRVLTAFSAAALYWMMIMRRTMRGRETADVAAVIALLLLLALSFTGEIGVHYLAWPLPFLAVALSGKMVLITNAVYSGYIITVYTLYSRGIPWSLIDLSAPAKHPGLPARLDVAALPVWIFTVVLTVILARQIGERLRTGRSLRWTPETTPAAP